MKLFARMTWLFHISFPKGTFWKCHEVANWSIHHPANSPFATCHWKKGSFIRPLLVALLPSEFSSPEFECCKDGAFPNFPRKYARSRWLVLSQHALFGADENFGDLIFFFSQKLDQPSSKNSHSLFFSFDFREFLDLERWLPLLISLRRLECHTEPSLNLTFQSLNMDFLTAAHSSSRIHYFGRWKKKPTIFLDFQSQKKHWQQISTSFQHVQYSVSPELWFLCFLTMSSVFFSCNTSRVVSK